MAVTTTNNSVAYTGDGSSVDFTVTFQFFVATDLIVTVTDTNGNTVTKVLNTDYTVTGGNDATGTVVFNTAPAAGYTVQIVRAIPYTQPDVFIDNDINDANVQMEALDRLTMLTQQNVFTGSRSITQPAADVNSMPPLPTAANRAGKYLAFDPSGNPICTVEVGSWRSTWAVGTAYNIGDVISDGAAGNNTLDIYTAIKANTASASFSNDVAAGDWAKVLDVVQLGVNAGVKAIASLQGTSITSLTVGTGSQTFTTQTSLAFGVGEFVIIVDSANTANWMIGQVTAYNSGTGSMTVSVTATGGNGTIATWDIFLSGSPQQITSANPSATIVGGAAINGSATTFMRSDAAPSLVLTNATNVILSDISLNNISNYFDGPSVNVGVSGTWFVSGNVSVTDTAGLSTFLVKLWDGTTVIASATLVNTGTGDQVGVNLSGIITSPAGNLRISVRDESRATGVILHNASGNGKDGIITAFRIG